MTRLMIPALMLIVAASCNAPAPEAAATVTKTPYSIKPNYSSDFEPGKREQAQIVLDCWRYYDNNTIDSITQFISDSIEMTMPGMPTMKMQRDSAMAATKMGRGMFSSVKSEIDVVLPLQESNKKDDWVLIWGRETAKTQEGKESKRELHEVFGFDKNGKINRLEQFEIKQ